MSVHPVSFAGGDPSPAPREAPRSFIEIVRQLGPGLIITATIVGSGELIVTPKLGAEEGFRLLWFIIAGCLLKVFVQIELGRYAITRGQSTLEVLNEFPGPRVLVSWVMWIWLGMYISLVFQVAGMVGGTAAIFSLAGLEMPLPGIAIAVGASCAILLVLGRYKLVERFSIALVVFFTLSTFIAVVALQGTPSAVTGAQLAEGFKFHLPGNLVTAFGAFGIIGVGASELIYYPYWCLEKGYARSAGADDGSAAWTERARGWLRVMRIDAWTSFVIYTSATIAFYLLGAAILHSRGLRVGNDRMIETLSHMYRDSIGQWSYLLFLGGAFVVLYSTIFSATAGNARLFADALALFRVKHYRDGEHRMRWIKIGCVGLPVVFTLVYLVVGAPVSLVFVGAVGQGLMIPFLAIAAVWLHFTRQPRALRAGPWSLGGLIIATALMCALGVYQVFSTLRNAV
ncbi:MAG: Nramp family divalent metal transporter [Opitutaceae bacterium]